MGWALRARESATGPRGRGGRGGGAGHHSPQCGAYWVWQRCLVAPVCSHGDEDVWLLAVSWSAGVCCLATQAEAPCREKLDLLRASGVMASLAFRTGLCAPRTGGAGADSGCQRCWTRLGRDHGVMGAWHPKKPSCPGYQALKVKALKHVQLLKA